MQVPDLLYLYCLYMTLVLPNILETEGFESKLAALPYRDKSSEVEDGSGQGG